MFCSKCGKEIGDDSKFCYSCGSKIDFVKPCQNIENVSITPINTDTYTTNEDTKEKSPIINNYQTDLKPPLKTKLDLKKGYGWFVLLWIYGYGMSIIMKKDPYYGEIYSIIISLLGLIVIFPFYFWFRKYLIKKNFWKGHIGSSSCLSGVVSYILVSSLVVGSISFIGSYEKRKEINQFMNNFQKQTEVLNKQDMEFSKMLSSEFKTVLELKNKIVNIDEYKIFRGHNTIYY